MKLTRLISTLLTPADAGALRRMRSLLRGGPLAYINDRVVVLMDTEETDPTALAAIARESMAEAQRDMYAAECFVADDGLDAVRLAGGKVYVFSHPGDPQYTMHSRWTLLQLGLAACASGEVQAIVTDDDTSDEPYCAPEDVDPAAPPRNYMQALGVSFRPPEAPQSPAVDPLSLPDDQIDWDEIIDFDDDPSAPPPDLFGDDDPAP